MHSVSHPFTLRVIDDPPLDGPTNMARDEAMLDRVGRSESPPTLRLYQWNAPTISLGYFQPYAEYETLPPPAGKLPVARRLTGGGAILHDLELTYSLAFPIDHPAVAHGANRLYELAHDAIVSCLVEFGVSASRCGESDRSGAARGPFFCFERRHPFDVVVGEHKVAGSAQRRRRDAVLQHGSIILGNRYSQHIIARLTLPFEETVSYMRTALPRRLCEVTNATYQPGEWSVDERTAATNLIDKYSGDAWTKRS